MAGTITSHETDAPSGHERTPLGPDHSLNIVQLYLVHLDLTKGVVQTGQALRPQSMHNWIAQKRPDLDEQ
jgi:hypothetical protein